MQVVNGYVCQTCSDVDLARRNVDPAHPDDDPKSPKYDPKKAAVDRGPAVSFGGVLANLNKVSGVQAPANSASASTATGSPTSASTSASAAAANTPVYGLQATGTLLNLSA